MLQTAKTGSTRSGRTGKALFRFQIGFACPVGDVSFEEFGLTHLAPGFSAIIPPWIPVLDLLRIAERHGLQNLDAPRNAGSRLAFIIRTERVRAFSRLERMPLRRDRRSWPNRS
jgi:hypothetical protein